MRFSAKYLGMAAAISAAFCAMAMAAETEEGAAKLALSPGAGNRHRTRWID